METLLFWGLALYGAVMVTWQGMRRLQRRQHRSRPLTYLLVVRNNEANIEGVVRDLLLRTAMSRRDREVYVIDMASTDDTPRILRTLSNDHACLRYTVVEHEVEFFHELESVCLNAARVVCIYDLRSGTQDVTEDLTTLCQ